MLRQPISASPRDFGKWCAYAVALLAPGSFVVLPAIWLYRLVAAQVARKAARSLACPGSS
jgi:hypothetical protein